MFYPWAQSTPIPVSTFPGCLLGPPMQATNRKSNGNLAVLVGSPAKNIVSMVDCIHSHMLECITISRGNDKNTDSLVVTSASGSIVIQKVSYICIFNESPRRFLCISRLEKSPVLWEKPRIQRRKSELESNLASI